MNGRIKPKIMLIASCLLLGITGFASARQIFVDVDAAGNNDGSSWTDAYNLLQDALAAAVSGDDILVTKGTYKPDRGKTVAPGDRAATFQLKNGVSVKGGYAGVTQADPNARDTATYQSILSGDLNSDDEPNFANHAENSYQVVTGSGTDEAAVLDGFTITGGGMYCKSGSPTIANCVFMSNTAWHGGAMRNYYSSPTLINCTFSSNSAEHVGGAMYNFGSNPKLTGCTFSDNRASNAGAMYNHADSHPMLSNCTFSKNSAQYSGAVANYFNSNAVLANCKLSENSAEFGGAMRNYKSSPTLVNCTFTRNSATGDGGAMNNNSSSPTITGCVFSGNATRSYGGAIRNFESSPTLVNCTLTHNSAKQAGGGISNLNNSNPTLSNCILWLNNDANGANEAAQIFSLDSRPTVNYCCIQSWTGTLAGVGNMHVDPKFVDANAGDYHLQPKSPCVDTGEPRPSEGLGEPNYLATADSTDIDGQPRIINNRVDIGADEYDNRRLVPAAYATIQAAIDAAVDGDTIIISPGTYKGPGNRDIDFKGKAITVRSTDPDDPKVVAATIIDCEKEGRAFHFNNREGANSVLAGLTIINGYQTNGGGIYCTNSSPTLSNCVFKNNWAKYAGGGVCNSGGKATLTNCAFSENLAYYGGGGIQNNSMASPTLVKCTFIKNWAKYGGGGMQNHDGSNATLSDCTFSQNSSSNRGAGIDNYQSSPRLTECTFSRNSAKSNGGGMYNVGGKPELTNCTFSENSASDNGGGMYNLYSSPILIGCVFSNNIGNDNGGGMFSGSSNPTLTRCKFTKNRASNNGGGIYSRNDTVTLTNCIFTANSAGANGGAINNNSKAVLANCTLNGNFARGQGGGIHTGGSDYSKQSALTLTNCILWDNRDSGKIKELAQICGGRFSVAYCCIQDADPNDTSVYAGVGNIDDEPCFVRLGQWADADNPGIRAEPGGINAVWIEGDYHLLPESPCIDAGDPNSDFSLEPAPNGSRIDMGAYGNTPEATAKPLPSQGEPAPAQARGQLR